MYPGKDTIVPIGASLGAYKGQNWERKTKMETKVRIYRGININEIREAS